MRERPRSSGGGDKPNLIVRPPFETEHKKELLKVRKLADKARSSTAAPQTLEDLTEDLTSAAGGEWTKAPTEATEASPKPPHPLPVGQMFRQEVKNNAPLLVTPIKFLFLYRCTPSMSERMWPCLGF